MIGHKIHLRFQNNDFQVYSTLLNVLINYPEFRNFNSENILAHIDVSKVENIQCKTVKGFSKTIYSAAKVLIMANLVAKQIRGLKN